MIHGKQLIAGQWVAGDDTFRSTPVSGAPDVFTVATSEQARTAAEQASFAFPAFADTSRAQRAQFLETIADAMQADSEAIVSCAIKESGLPEARLTGELGRTTGQLRLFADAIRDADYLDRRYTSALPDRQPLPRPDLRLMMRPIGPVVVFGASNFPLAFSTAGGDTASALAAGCPVIVKSHPAHPATGERVAAAIAAAAAECRMPDGVFSYLHDAGTAVARALVTHPLVKAVGFTGSLKAGRALFDLCAARPEPIPFFGELGSTNPGFVLGNALDNRCDAIAEGWAQSLTMGVGQFCTNPGVMFLRDGEQADRFSEATRRALSEVGVATMLTASIAAACHSQATDLSQIAGVATRVKAEPHERGSSPWLFDAPLDVWRANRSLREEIFGPVGVIVRVRNDDDLLTAAASLDGQLTATLHMDDADLSIARTLLPVLEQKAGRILANGFPTGVEVDPAMMHGGPYPASTNVGATSVGTLAIRRFLRPVSYQNLPDALLPADLRDGSR
ncbi:MAG: aldehyde dehydrogenase (NADP(+)) [Pseudomonadota bacterium]